MPNPPPETPAQTQARLTELRELFDQVGPGGPLAREDVTPEFLERCQRRSEQLQEALQARGRAQGVAMRLAVARSKQADVVKGNRHARRQAVAQARRTREP